MQTSPVARLLSNGAIEKRASPAIRRLPAARSRHEPDFHSRQSGARQCRLRNDEDAGRRARCASRAGRRRPAAKAPSAFSRAAPNSSRNISRRCATCARADSRSRPSTGAGRAARSARCPIRARDMCAISREYETDVEVFMREVVLPDCPPPHLRARPFDGRERAAADGPQGLSLVRPHGDVGADDRAAPRRPIRASRSRR